MALAPQKPQSIMAARNEGRLNSSEESQCRALIDKAIDVFGGIDVLVNKGG